LIRGWPSHHVTPKWRKTVVPSSREIRTKSMRKGCATRLEIGTGYGCCSSACDWPCRKAVRKL